MQQAPRMRQPAHPQGQFMVRQPPPQPQAAAAAVNNAAAMAARPITGAQPTAGPQRVAGKMLYSSTLLLNLVNYRYFKTCTFVKKMYFYN